jgi:hypothetical protein
MSEYAEQVKKAVSKMCMLIDITFISGWHRGYWQTFSRCCSAMIHVRSLMEGIPFCDKCRKDLGPDDLRYEWVPPSKYDENSLMECPWPMEPDPR